MKLKKALVIAATAASMSAGVAFAGDAAGHKSAVKELSSTSKEGAQKMLKMKASGEFDHDFLMMMRQHHQDGIKMSQIAVEHASDPQLKQKAQQMIQMQQKDIAEFDAMMQAHHSPQGTGGSGDAE